MLAPATERAGLELLIQYFRTGDGDLFRRHDIDWLKQSHDVDYIFGFIEVFTDVRSKKGAWEAFVTMTDMGRNRPLQALAKEALYFEQKLPWPDKYRSERPPRPRCGRWAPRGPRRSKQWAAVRTTRGQTT